MINLFFRSQETRRVPHMEFYISFSFPIQILNQFSKETIIIIIDNIPWDMQNDNTLSLDIHIV